MTINVYFYLIESDANFTHPQQPMAAGHVRVVSITVHTEDAAQQDAAALTVNSLSPLCQHRKGGFISASLFASLICFVGRLTRWLWRHKKTSDRVRTFCLFDFDIVT